MKIGIIGVGSLGRSLANFFVYKRVPLFLSDIKRIKDFESFPKYKAEKVFEKTDIVFLCVKPNDVKEVSKNVKVNNAKAVISLVAGISFDTLQDYFDKPIIRCMTNIPIKKMKGSLTYYGEDLNRELEKTFLQIMEGPEIIRVNNEQLLDLSTIMIGSMPAFITYLAEEYIDFGCRNGLTYEESKKLYISTALGTMEIFKKESGEEIIDAVCSPNGVTEKGIDYLECSGIKDLIKESLKISLKNIKKY